MKYWDQLQTPEWRKLRKTIIERDNCLCQSCFNQKIYAEQTISIPAALGFNQANIWLPVINLEHGHTYVYKIEDTPINKNIRLKQSEFYSVLLNKIDDVFIVVGVERFSHDYSDTLRNIEEKRSANEHLLTNCHPFDRTALTRTKKELEIEHTVLLGILNDLKNENKRWLLVPYLEVHHRFYVDNRMSWEYANDDLVTYCNSCHREWHRSNKIEIRNAEGFVISELTPCLRCNGTGYLEEFRHVRNGICFRCWAVKYDEFL